MILCIVKTNYQQNTLVKNQVRQVRLVRDVVPGRVLPLSYCKQRASYHTPIHRGHRRWLHITLWHYVRLQDNNWLLQRERLLLQPQLWLLDWRRQVVEVSNPPAPGLSNPLPARVAELRVAAVAAAMAARRCPNHQCCSAHSENPLQKDGNCNSGVSISYQHLCCCYRTHAMRKRYTLPIASNKKGTASQHRMCHAGVTA